MLCGILAHRSPRVNCSVHAVTWAFFCFSVTDEALAEEEIPVEECLLVEDEFQVEDTTPFENM